MFGKSTTTFRLIYDISGLPDLRLERATDGQPSDLTTTYSTSGRNGDYGKRTTD